ncbi:alpha/beta fold hydrolase [Amycolatopsis sp. FDAARGOS 1241]|uniref:alpha/beta fold hydrolase n=1 Tax=Amycolatopsis sp. FDAARGOS 1241 TaxID=2778070 RepID=UPI00351C8AEE
MPNHAGEAYDWIGFDPRGVGSSKPAVMCDGSYFSSACPPYVPATPQLERTWLAKTEGYAKACAKNGAILDHLKTTDVAQDTDSLRVALGERRINYYGFSCSTYLCQVYSTLYPGHVRRMVLDGNVDPRKVRYQADLDQDVAFDRNIKITASGSRSTTRSTTSATPVPPWRSGGTTSRRSWSARPRAASSVATSGPTGRRSRSSTTTPTRPVTTTDAPCTAPSNARTCSGRRTGTAGASTIRKPTSARRSRRGGTRGSPRLAGTGPRRRATR